MRQHAIPQNILDVEFKIFTKFTLKEFAYLAIGIGTGGLFLYFYAKDQIPAIIAIPIFVVSSGIGIFFALIPINDQPADKFLKNFLAAIRKPTRRVWLDSKMKKARTQAEVKLAKEVVSKNLEDETKRPKIIGSSKINTEKEKIDDRKLDLLEDNNPVPEKPVLSELTTKNKTLVEKLLVLTSENIKDYQFDMEGVDRLPGNINLWISDKNFKPIPDVIVQLSDKNGKLLYANKTPTNGYFLTNKIFEEGIYFLELTNSTISFPNIKIVLDKDFNKRPIKITAI